jgi:serine protease Do
MKRIGTTLLIALTGGVVALGGYKLFETKQQQNLTFEERQNLHYANLNNEVTSSTGNPDFTQASAVVAPGVVHIKTTYAPRRSSSGRSQSQQLDLFEEFFGLPRSQRSQPQQAVPLSSTGSGVIISADGYIVTNNHVVEDAEKIEVSLTDRRSYEAKIIGRDPNTDVALIKIEEKNLPFVKLGNSDNVRIGEWVLAVGYPLGLESTVTAGIVSATGRSTGIIRNEMQQRQWQERGFDTNEPIVNTAIESFIQTDAVINKGNSGGALVNAQGELIGINSNIMSPSGYYAGYGFAVPVNIVKKIADDFVKYGAVKRGLIGINFRDLSPEVAKNLGISETQGLYINEVVEGGAAQKAGLRKGDVLTKLDGKTIFASPDLQEKVYRMRPGDKVNLTYKRDGKEREVTVTLQEESKDQLVASTNRSATSIYNKLGAGFTAASDDKKEELGIKSGVVVGQVNRGGLLDRLNVTSGMVITHINDIPVNNITEIEKALEKSKQNMIKLTVVPRKNSEMTFSTPID